MSGYPSYIELYRKGELQLRIDALMKLLEECRLCPRECRIDRVSGEKGVCRAGADLEISSAFPHFGEEPPLVGWGGSGTIFLTHCNLRCIFCQNFDISHLGKGKKVSVEEFALHMLRLQNMGCHNINFVTPTHYAPQIISALPLAIEGGLEVPLVWNCGGYESIEVIRLLDGIVDIYMPDVKYSREENAEKYSKAPGYFTVVREVLKEMHRQVGDLEIDNRGIARRGLLIRHLVMPDDIAGSDEVLRFIAGEISKNSYVNIMDQYHPCYKAHLFPEINRPITESEYLAVLKLAKALGLERRG